MASEMRYPERVTVEPYVNRNNQRRLAVSLPVLYAGDNHNEVVKMILDDLKYLNDGEEVGPRSARVIRMKVIEAMRSRPPEACVPLEEPT